MSKYKVIEIKNKNIDYTKFIKRRAEESDYETLITESCIGVENGEVKFVYQELDWDTSDIVKALKKIKYPETERSNGLITRSRIFGFRPRITMRSDFCSSASLATDFPQEHQLICNLAQKIEELYGVTAPEQFKYHKGVTDEKIKKGFKVAGSVFTSGIINKNNPLNYHFDAGNFKSVFSCMPVFKSGIKGGYLALPEYGLGIELKNNSILMFDGQSIMHGVTPISFLNEVAYRFSIVYYSLKNIWQCLEIDDEIARIRNKKMERERLRANPTPEHTAKLNKHLADQIKRKEKYEGKQ